MIITESACNQDDDKNTNTNINKGEVLNYKLIAIGTILISGGVGVGLPLLGRRIQILRPENDIFFMVKAFAAGVILATGFIHILPEAFESLTSPCLKDNPWGRFPFSGFVAMMAAIGTLMIDSFATGYYKRQHFKDGNNKVVVIGRDEEGGGDGGDESHVGHVHVHTHATHGHAHGASDSGNELPLHELIRKRVISQVRWFEFFLL